MGFGRLKGFVKKGCDCILGSEIGDKSYGPFQGKEFAFGREGGKNFPRAAVQDASRLKFCGLFLQNLRLFVSSQTGIHRYRFDRVLRAALGAGRDHPLCLGMVLGALFAWEQVRAQELPGYQDLIPPLPQAEGLAPPGTAPAGGDRGKSKKSAERITLKRALEKAMASNRKFLKDKITFLKSEIQYKQARDKLYVPTITLALSSSNSVFTLGELKRPNSLAEPRRYKQGFPTDATTTLSLKVQESLFNRFDDLAAYQTAKFTFDQARETWANALRDLRFSIFETMFKVRIAQDKVDLAKVSLQVAEAVLANIQAKKRAGKAQDADVSSAEVAVTEAKTKVNDFETGLRNELRAFNLQLGDPVGTPYVVVTDDVRYNPVQITPEEAWATFLRYSIEMRTAKNSLRSAELALESSRRWFFPTVGMKLSAVPLSTDWKHHYYGTAAGLPGGASPQFEATVEFSVSWELFGPESGFLQGRKLELARLDYESSRIDFIDAVSNAQSAVMSELDGLKQLEVAVTNAEKTAQETSKILDSLVQQLQEGSVNQLELRSAIDKAREAQEERYGKMFEHMSKKRAFAQKIGLNQFPGDAF
jgi:outer membrane protein TolC